MTNFLTEKNLKTSWSIVGAVSSTYLLPYEKPVSFVSSDFTNSFIMSTTHARAKPYKLRPTDGDNITRDDVITWSYSTLNEVWPIIVKAVTA